MPATDDSKTPLRCHHCGREVGETIHTRSAYRVNYYALHTGAVEPMTMARSDDPSDIVTVLRLLTAVHVVTCTDCYRQPGVQRERELLFRSELATAGEQDAVS